MFSQRPKFIKPGDDELYPKRNKLGEIESIVKTDHETILAGDADSKTNFVYNRYHHLPISTQRQKLPIFQYRNHILYLLEKYQTLVLIGETGCGKSTQVPQYLQEVGHTVCVTQPRASATAALAARVALERGEEVGEGVGCAANMVDRRSTKTRITFMTEGVLLREMFASPLLMQYTCIVLDEVHERSLMTDVLMGLLKKILKKRKKLKLIVSSATMDAEFLRDFFDLSGDNKTGIASPTSIIMSVQGRLHPVDVYYAQEPVADYLTSTIETIIKIHENEPFGDILAFLTSQEEILSAMETLSSYAIENKQTNKTRNRYASGIQTSDLNPVPMYGTLPHYKQVAAFQTLDKRVRKVVLATNIAETSVTIPGITYVIDCGFHKLPYYNPSVGVVCLSVTAISKSNATQRAGRAGRTGRGKCYRLYTEDEYDKLPKAVPPEICRSDLSPLLLQLKALGIHNLLRFTFPTPPPAKLLLAGLESLYALKAIDKSGILTQDGGSKMAELPVGPMCAAMLCNSAEYGCIEEILSIASMLQVEGVFPKFNNPQRNMAAKISRRNNFEVAEGDVMMYLNVFDAYLKIRSSECEEKRIKKVCQDWCSKMYINHRVMEKAFEIRCSLEKLIKDKFGMTNNVFMEPDLGSGKCERIMKCFISGYFTRAAKLSYAGDYEGVRGARLRVASDSCLNSLNPPWVVFAGVQNSSDGYTYMRDLMAIKKNWLLEVAPHYYKET